jgi:8-oxo-dGTP diphosphatase
MAHQIEAAGVVLVRRGGSGPTVAVVHRPHRSDWSLPKGKLDPDEEPAVAAVRETHEETGVRCVLGPSLGERRYEVDGMPKRVRYWRATAAELDVVERQPDDEVDDVRWLGPDEARALLTYPEDRQLVSDALALPDTVATVVLRHAEARKRAWWRESGDPLADVDAARPLDEHGMTQAVALVPRLAAYGIRHVISSDARRCRATIEPYADHAGVDVTFDHGLSEEGCAEDPRTTAAAVARLLERGGPAVWCTHRPVLPVLLAALASGLGLDRRDDRLDPRLKPGAALVVHRAADGTPEALERLEA